MGKGHTGARREEMEAGRDSALIVVENIFSPASAARGAIYSAFRCLGGKACCRKTTNCLLQPCFINDLKYCLREVILLKKTYRDFTAFRAQIVEKESFPILRLSCLHGCFHTHLAAYRGLATSAGLGQGQNDRGEEDRAGCDALTRRGLISHLLPSEILPPKKKRSGVGRGRANRQARRSQLIFRRRARAYIRSLARPASSSGQRQRLRQLRLALPLRRQSVGDRPPAADQAALRRKSIDQSI
jgi:hypothetical protein